MATYYIDFENTTGTLTGTWTATGTAFAGSGGAATSELAVGDYVRLNSGARTWYQVTVITDDDTFTVDYSAATIGDTISGATLEYHDYSANDGSTTGAAHCSLHCFRVQGPDYASGDIVYYRGGQTEYLHGANFQWLVAAGTATALTKFICDTDGSIFSDSSPGRTNLYHIRSRTWIIAPPDYCYIEGFKMCVFGSGDVRCYWMYCLSRTQIFFKNVWFSAAGGASGDGQHFKMEANNTQLYFEDCEFETDGAWIAQQGSSRCHAYFFHLKNCYIYKNNGSAGGGFNVCLISRALYEDCHFGYNPAMESRPLNRVVYIVGGVQRFRNCKFNTTNDITGQAAGYSGIATFEDYNQVLGDNRIYYCEGHIQTETTTVRSGGGDVSLKMVPVSTEVTLFPLEAYKYPDEITVYLAKDVEHTVSMYVNTYTWSTLPDNTELYLKVLYLDTASSSSRTQVVSTETVASNGTWTELSVTFTPSESGLAHCSIVLSLFEASSGVYVDPIPVVS